MRISEAWKHYEQDKSILNYSKVTLKSYKIQHRLLYESIGDIDIKDVTYQQLKDYLYSLVGRLKPSSIGHRIRFVQSLFRWAVDEGHVSKNPASKLKEPKMGDRIPKFLTEEEVETLREACQTPREHAIVEFLYTTGCRIGEAVSVDVADLNWNKKSLIVKGKGNKEREVYFNMKCAIWLKKYLETRKGDHPALFITERDPHRLSIERMRETVKEIAKRSGMNINVYPHRLRHSFACHLLDNGAPMEAIQQMLGHEKAETTAIYAQLSGERRREIYKRYF